jgi:hypothetical protein
MTVKMKILISPRIVRAICVAFLLSILGCNLLTPLVFMVDPKKRVAPEFDKLAHRRVVILVWTDPATLFDYPHARFELASYVWEKLSLEMTQRQLDVDVVDPRDVEDLIQRDAEARIDPQRVGRAVNADFCIYLEVTRFQLRNPHQPQFIQADIEASVAVHDTRSSRDDSKRFPLTSVRAVYPERAPALMSATNVVLIREGAYRDFAERVARKFYEHTLSQP